MNNRRVCQQEQQQQQQQQQTTRKPALLKLSDRIFKFFIWMARIPHLFVVVLRHRIDERSFGLFAFHGGFGVDAHPAVEGCLAVHVNRHIGVITGEGVFDAVEHPPHLHMPRAHVAALLV